MVSGELSGDLSKTIDWILHEFLLVKLLASDWSLKALKCINH